ncbi:MAG: hypothetical protein ACQZ2J_01985 [Pseudomonas piscis]|uniref:hypothetical protein n=1 Tax=Pseudomonas piscis TaxID=2614538 RepID=UPI003D2773AC
MNLTFQSTIAAYRSLLEANPGMVLMQDEHNVAFLHGSELLGCYIANGVVASDVYDFDSSAFSEEEGGWVEAGDATREFIENPRFTTFKEIGLDISSL